MKVLVVEDSKSDRLLLSEIFTSNNYEVAQAYNGIEALKSIQESKPDLIISDILMPGMDGFTLLRELKKDKQMRDIPFVFYTAHYADEKDKELALKLGVSRFIVKPVGSKELLHEIETVFREYKTGNLKPAESLLKSDEEYLRHYNERIARKLEEKIAQLENTKNFLDTVLDNMEDGVIATDPELKVIYCNKRMQEMIKCGFAPGRLPPDAMHTPCIPDMAHATHRLFEVDHLTEKGVIVHLEGIVSSVTNENGELIEHIGVFRDITERIKAREEIERKNSVIALLSDLDRMFMDCETSSQFIECSLNKIMDILDVEGGCVYLVNEMDKKAEVRLCKGLPPKFVELIKQQSSDNPAIQQVLTSQTHVIISPLSARITGLSESDQEYGVEHIITVQLKAKKKIIGFIDLMVSPYRRFNSEELNLLEEIGMHLCVALENLFAIEKQH